MGEIESEEMQTEQRAVVETEDWKLGCFLDWRPKSHTEKCSTCNGLREIGGGFADLDGSRPCDQCFGTGFITKGPRTPRPKLPAELVEHMRRAWWDFFHAA